MTVQLLRESSLPVSFSGGTNATGIPLAVCGDQDGRRPASMSACTFRCHRERRFSACLLDRPRDSIGSGHPWKPTWSRSWTSKQD